MSEDMRGGEMRPPPPFDADNDFHEVWWNSVAGGWAPSGKLNRQTHAVWQYMGDAAEPWWERPGDAREYTPAEVYEEGWRWVRRIELFSYARPDGEAPDVSRKTSFSRSSSLSRAR